MAVVEDRIAFAFARYDYDGDGTLSLPEFHAIVSATDLDVDDARKTEVAQRAKALFRRADLNGDGGIDLVEFRALVAEHPELLDEPDAIGPGQVPSRQEPR